MLVRFPGRAVILASVFLAVACDDLRYDDGMRDASGTQDGSNDAGQSANDSARADSETDAGEHGAFGPPEMIEDVSAPESHDSQPEISPDGLELYFVRAARESSAYAIWLARRATPTSQWDSPAPVAEINGAALRTCEPTISGDGLEIWFASDRGGTWDVWSARRSTLNDAWGDPAQVTSLATTESEISADVFSNDRILLATVGTPGALYMSMRETPDGPWSVPNRMSALEAVSVNRKAFVLDDGRTVYFGSDRVTPGKTDLYFVSRETLAGEFGAPAFVGGLSSAGNDDDPWLSPDAREIYFASDREGTWDIYRATR